MRALRVVADIDSIFHELRTESKFIAWVGHKNGLRGRNRTVFRDGVSDRSALPGIEPGFED